MYKVVNGTKMSFFDENDNEIMYIDYPNDECVWFFKSSEVLIIAEDEELYEPLISLFLEQYEFNNNSELVSYKNDNELVWYSDCYYNPDDEWSKNNVSYLKIVFTNNTFKIKCIKPLYDIIDKKNKSHVIAFSPLGNGNYSRNINTGLSFQDDFVIKVYQKLLQKDIVRKINM